MNTTHRMVTVVMHGPTLAALAPTEREAERLVGAAVRRYVRRRRFGALAARAVLIAAYHFGGVQPMRLPDHRGRAWWKAWVVLGSPEPAGVAGRTAAGD